MTQDWVSLKPQVAAHLCLPSAGNAGKLPPCLHFYMASADQTQVLTLMWNALLQSELSPQVSGGPVKALTLLEQTQHSAMAWLPSSEHAHPAPSIALLTGCPLWSGEFDPMRFLSLRLQTKTGRSDPFGPRPR